jgi:hypothetical protein
VVRGREREGLQDTVWWGYFLLVTTWGVFILGIGGVLGVWEWSLKPIRVERTSPVHNRGERREALMVGDEGGRGVGYGRILQFIDGSDGCGGSLDMGCSQLGWDEVL